MNKTEALNHITCNPKQVKELPKTSAKEKQDKPFCQVLDEVIKKAYPTARTYEKEEKSERI